MAKFCIFWLRGSHAFINLDRILGDNPVFDGKVMYAWCRYDQLEDSDINALSVFMSIHDMSYFTYDLSYKMKKADAELFCKRYCEQEIKLEYYRDKHGKRELVAVTRQENFYVRDCQSESLMEFIDNHMQRVPLKFLNKKTQHLLCSLGYLDAFVDDDVSPDDIDFDENERWLASAKEYSDVNNWQCEVALLSVLFSPLVVDTSDPICSMHFDERSGLWERKRI